MTTIWLILLIVAASAASAGTPTPATISNAATRCTTQRAEVLFMQFCSVPCWQIGYAHTMPAREQCWLRMIIQFDAIMQSSGHTTKLAGHCSPERKGAQHGA